MTEKYNPTVNGKASICHWDLTVRFRTKEQMVNFIDDLIDYDNWSIVPFTINHELYEGDYYYVLTIDDYPWAEHLVEIGKLLDKYDYGKDIEEVE